MVKTFIVQNFCQHIPVKTFIVYHLSIFIALTEHLSLEYTLTLKLMEWEERLLVRFVTQEKN